MTDWPVTPSTNERYTDRAGRRQKYDGDNWQVSSGVDVSTVEIAAAETVEVLSGQVVLIDNTGTAVLPDDLPGAWVIFQRPSAVSWINGAGGPILSTSLAVIGEDWTVDQFRVDKTSAGWEVVTLESPVADVLETVMCDSANSNQKVSVMTPLDSAGASAGATWYRRQDATHTIFDPGDVGDLIVCPGEGVGDFELLISEEATLASFPAAASNTDRLGILTALDGANLPGLYRSDGTDWLPVWAPSIEQEWTESATFAAFPAAASNTGRLGILTADDGGNNAGVYESDGTDWLPKYAPTITGGGAAEASQYFESLAVLTNSTTTYSSKMDTSAAAVDGGDYMVELNFAYNGNNTTSSLVVEFLIDDVSPGTFSNGEIMRFEPQDVAGTDIDGTGADMQSWHLSKHKVTLAAGATPNFKLNIKSSAASSLCAIWDATVELRPL